jgi:hypothetical protein
MTNEINCPVCGRDVKVEDDLRCPVCESDLSALVGFRTSVKSSDMARSAYSRKLRLWRALVAGLSVLMVVAVAVFFLTRPKQTPATPETAVLRATRTPSATSIPPTFTPSATLLQPSAGPAPYVIVLEFGANCRMGPSRDNPIIVTLSSGTESEILTYVTMIDTQWFYIRNPRSPERACWVWSGSVRTEGSLEQMTPIPPPAYP